MSAFQLHIDRDVAKAIVELYAAAFDSGQVKEPATRLVRVIHAVWPELIPSYLEPYLK